MRAEPEIVAGWAIGEDLNKPVQVKLLVNDIEMAQMVANKPRPCLKERGRHPTGLCGFVFKFVGNKKLNVGDKIELVPMAGHFMKPNSLTTIQITQEKIVE